jgi:hypothetical protein
VRRIFAALFAALPLYAAAADKPVPARVERNVVYGMYSGAALLLDVYRPAKPNGYGIVFVAGSGFQADSAYGARPIKDTQIDLWGPPLNAAGYTVFSVNHRGAPRFHYPAALEDVQRAIRFVRAHAQEYGIDPAHLGGLGGSSGGNLIGLAALRGAPGSSDDADAVNREPATLQAIVLRAAVSDLRGMPTPEGANFVVSYMEFPPGDAVKGLYEAASYRAFTAAEFPGGVSMYETTKFAPSAVGMLRRSLTAARNTTTCSVAASRFTTSASSGRPGAARAAASPMRLPPEEPPSPPRRAASMP